MSAERIEALVIGGGQAGLGVSRELALRGIEHLVLERGRVGESWISQRWDSFALNSPAWMNTLPGQDAPDRPDTFSSAREFALQLQRYAFCHRLPVREGVTVRSVEAGSTLRVRTDDREYEAGAVVVAAGITVPRIPAVAPALDPSIHQVHAAGYRRADALPPGRVLVVGGGQSGLQIAEDLLDAGRDVLLATSLVARMPRRYRGRDTYAWLVEDGFFDEPPGANVGRPVPQLSGTAGGHTISYQQLQRRGAVLLGGLAGAPGSRVRLDVDLARNIVFADAASSALRARIDAHIVRTGADAPPPEDDPADEPFGVLPDGPRELDVRRAGITSVIWATGFAPTSGFLPSEVVRAGGEIAQRGGATPLPGLFVTGLPWLRARRSGTILGVATDAPHIAELVVRRAVPGLRLAA